MRLILWSNETGMHMATKLKPVPTLDDVAEVAGVSTATVSRCLNSPEHVGEKTRLKVMTVVQQLGYTPNFGAQALAAKRTNTIGAIVPTIDNAIFAKGIQAFQDELENHGITLLVASSSYDPVLEERQIRKLVSRGADGLFLIGLGRSAEITQFLKDRGIPYVASWVFDPDGSGPTVGFSNKEAMYELAHKVLELGHRRIGYISAPRETNDRAAARFEGLRQAVTDCGLNADDIEVEQAIYSFEDGKKAFKALMLRDRKPSVVLCGNDVLAVGAIKMAHEMGLNVPEDVSITGFDDIEIASVVEPALTTVHVPHKKMGNLAARALVGQISEGESAPSIKLKTHLMLRQTLGRPNAAFRT